VFNSQTRCKFRLFPNSPPYHHKKKSLFGMSPWPLLLAAIPAQERRKKTPRRARQPDQLQPAGRRQVPKITVQARPTDGKTETYTLPEHRDNTTEACSRHERASTRRRWKSLPDHVRMTAAASTRRCSARMVQNNNSAVEPRSARYAKNEQHQFHFRT